jgi:hypothetical protein
MRPLDLISPIAVSSRLVLPAPFGPMTVTMWPFSTVSDALRTASALP